MALNKFKPRSVSSIKPQGLSAKISSAKAPTRTKQTISDVLRAIPLPNSTEKLYDEKQVEIFSEVIYPDGKHVFVMGDLDLILHVAGWTIEFGYEKALEFIYASKNRDELMWGNPTLKKAREADEKEKIILKEPEVGMKNIGKCGRCGSENIVFTETQTSSGDEGFTYRFFCTDCPHRWRVR